jgi:hypothetical protein
MLQYWRYSYNITTVLSTVYIKGTVDRNETYYIILRRHSLRAFIATWHHAGTPFYRNHVPLMRTCRHSYAFWSKRTSLSWSNKWNSCSRLHNLSTGTIHGLRSWYLFTDRAKFTDVRTLQLNSGYSLRTREWITHNRLTPSRNLFMH